MSFQAIAPTDPGAATDIRTRMGRVLAATSSDMHMRMHVHVRVPLCTTDGALTRLMQVDRTRLFGREFLSASLEDRRSSARDDSDN
eukprot:3349815-Prymnesium_polylepis.1